MPTYAKVIAVIVASIIVLYSCAESQKEERENHIFHFNNAISRCEDYYYEDYNKQDSPRANDDEFIKYKCYYEVAHGEWFDEYYYEDY